MKLKTSQKGFTLVELLIVIVVIAILAAITIVAYNGLTQRAQKTANQESANQLRTKVTAWQGIQGSYPAYSDVFGGLANSDVPEAALEASVTEKLNGSGLTVTAEKPLAYLRCTTDGAIVTYFDPSATGTPGSFNIGDTATCPA